VAGLQVYQLIPKLMEKIGAISKDRKNPVGFRYRGIEDALNNMHPHLVELGLTVEIRCHSFQVEHFIEKGEKKDRLQFHATLLMDVVFVAQDGSRSERTAAGEGLDTAGDKATNKAMAAAFKYAVFLGLCIPVEDGSLDDPDQHGRKTDTAATAPPPQVIPSIPGDPIAAPHAGLTSGQVTGTAPFISPVQISEILELAQGIGMPPDVLQSVVAKYGVTKLDQLTMVAASELIKKLMSLQAVGSSAVPF